MSTTLLYHAFDLRTFKYQSMEIKGGCHYFHVYKKTVFKRCRRCKNKNTVQVGENLRTIRLMPIGFRKTFAVLHLKIFRCKDCKAECQEPIEDAKPRKSYSKRFARYVLELASITTLSTVSGRLGIGWDLGKEIVKEDLKRKVKRRKYKHIGVIAIDEISAKKGHDYLTLITDLESGHVIFVAEGKDSECLKPFFTKLHRAGAKLKACAIDMSGAYEKAINEYNASLPDSEAKCVIVNDHFHAVKQMNEALDAIRKDEGKKLEEQGQKLLKGSRFLLFMGKKKLREKPERIERLQALLFSNEILMKAWLLKEIFRLFWDQISKETARNLIEEWCTMVKDTTANKHLLRVMKMVRKHLENILAYYDFRISTGPLEGLNNKIKVMKRQAYGFRDMEFFKLRILTIHETKYQLTGA